MDSFQIKLRNYAKLLVQVGVNIQKGQALIIDASVDAVEFVRVVIDEAYESGARAVYVEWADSYEQRSRLLKSPIDELKKYPDWKARGYVERVHEGAAFLAIVSPAPGYMDQVPSARLKIAQTATQNARREFLEMHRNFDTNWSVAVVPSIEWAKYVFSDMDAQTALKQLWDSIFRVTRADRNNVISLWHDHLCGLSQQIARLNKKQYQALRYIAPGTDLTVELPLNHIWGGGSARTKGGLPCVPNIPTEEIFTAPLKTGANGVVTSTRPLFYGDEMITNLSLVFENGRITNYTATTGHDMLRSIIETDEGGIISEKSHLSQVVHQSLRKMLCFITRS